VLGQDWTKNLQLGHHSRAEMKQRTLTRRQWYNANRPRPAGTGTLT